MVLGWRKSVVWADIARVACGVIVCGLSAISQPWLSFAQILLGSLGLVFCWYLFTCMVKLVSEITIDEKGVALTRNWLPLLRVNWETAERIEVRHFSLGTFRRTGLMDIKLKSLQTTILIDDGVDRFPELLELVWKYTKQYGIELSETSKTNLNAARVLAATDQ